MSAPGGPITSMESTSGITRPNTREDANYHPHPIRTETANYHPSPIKEQDTTYHTRPINTKDTKDHTWPIKREDAKDDNDTFENTREYKKADTLEDTRECTNNDTFEDTRECPNDNTREHTKRDFKREHTKGDFKREHTKGDLKKKDTKGDLSQEDTKEQVFEFFHDVSNWTEHDVARFLQTLGAGSKWKKYAKMAISEGIDGVSVLNASMDILVDMGFTKIHAMTVIKSLKGLQSRGRGPLSRDSRQASSSSSTKGDSKGQSDVGMGDMYLPLTAQESKQYLQFRSVYSMLDDSERRAKSALVSLEGEKDSIMRQVSKKFGLLREKVAKEETKCLAVIESEFKRLSHQLSSAMKSVLKNRKQILEKEAVIKRAMRIFHLKDQPTRMETIRTVSSEVFANVNPLLANRPTLALNFTNALNRALTHNFFQLYAVDSKFTYNSIADAKSQADGTRSSKKGTTLLNVGLRAANYPSASPASASAASASAASAASASASAASAAAAYGGSSDAAHGGAADGALNGTTGRASRLGYLTEMQNGLTGVRLSVGSDCDALDADGVWRHATVVDKEDHQLKIHYHGWHDAWDVWVPLTSPKLQPYDSKTQGTYTGDPKIRQN